MKIAWFPTELRGIVPSAVLPVALLAFACDQKPSQQPHEPLTVELSTMSKCPFGNAMLRHLVPAMAPLAVQVELKVSYLGQMRGETLFSVRGDSEVTGDKLGLCAQELAAPEVALDFLSCQSRQVAQVPTHWEKCAKAAKIAPSELRSCSEGVQGYRLAKDSFLSNQQRGITSSPSLSIAGKPYQGPRHSRAVAAAVCRELGELSPVSCGSLEALRPYDVVLVDDSRCPAGVCDTSGLEASLRSALPAMSLRRLDWTEAAKQLPPGVVLRLPAAVVDKSLGLDQEALATLGASVRKLQDGRFLMTAGGRWDPSAEICTDGKDNDDDQLVDCKDDDCSGAVSCRVEVPRSLTVFVAEGAPFTSRLFSSLQRVFVADDDTTTVRVLHVGREDQTGWHPLNGQEHAEEVQRQLCIQKLSGRARPVPEYASCRIDTSEGPEECLPPDVQPAQLSDCIQKDGAKLALTSFRDASQVGVQRTPHVLVNNVRPIEGYAPNALRSGLCAANSGHAFCESP